MAEDPRHTQEDRQWTIGAGLVAGGFLLFSALFAFVILPVAQSRGAGIDAWTAICRSLGLAPGTPAQPQPTSTSVAAPVSIVTWTPATLAVLARADPRPGAAVAAEVCVDCHGENGYAEDLANPHLIGQSAAAIYKQLNDYRSGARSHKDMTRISRELAPAQLAQMAAFYAGSSSRQALGRRFQFPNEQIRKIAEQGDASRGLPPCESCHARGSGGPIETPAIFGQNQDYLAGQLRMYRSGERRNDLYMRMRTIAAKLTEAEIDQLAEYYQGFP